MGVIRKYNPSDRILSYCKRVHREVAGVEEDTRLTDAQRYAGVVKILRCDPALLVARQIELLMNGQSKWSERFNIDPMQIHKMLVDLHNMITPGPDPRGRRSADDAQFELDFAWHVSDGGEKVAVLPEAAE